MSPVNDLCDGLKSNPYDTSHLSTWPRSCRRNDPVTPRPQSPSGFIRTHLS